MDTIDTLLDTFSQELAGCSAEAELYNIKAAFLGKSGKLNTILKDVKNLSLEEKKSIGTKANSAKETALTLFEQRLAALEENKVNEQLKAHAQDISLRTSFFDLGANQAAYHPLTLVRREVEDLFISMGFNLLDGPYVEDEHHNFTALNIPADHPARDMQDTFWFSDMVHCLRTQTSAVQIRGMQSIAPPFKFVAAGKVFRNENIDASHEIAFHQIEGMVVDKNIGVNHMLFFLKTLLSTLFKTNIEVRLRSGFFPFVEPGFELDIACQLCAGNGCSVCKQSGWIEFCGCGITHANVLEAGGIDSTVWSGFAFGLGWDRLAMMRYGIEDIRHIHSGDLRFNKQFKVF